MKKREKYFLKYEVTKLKSLIYFLHCFKSTVLNGFFSPKKKINYEIVFYLLMMR